MVSPTKLPTGTWHCGHCTINHGSKGAALRCPKAYRFNNPPFEKFKARNVEMTIKYINGEVNKDIAIEYGLSTSKVSRNVRLMLINAREHHKVKQVSKTELRLNSDYWVGLVNKWAEFEKGLM